MTDVTRKAEAKLDRPLGQKNDARAEKRQARKLSKAAEAQQKLTSPGATIAARREEITRPVAARRRWRRRTPGSAPGA